MAPLELTKDFWHNAHVLGNTGTTCNPLQVAPKQDTPWKPRRASQGAPCCQRWSHCHSAPKPGQIEEKDTVATMNGAMLRRKRSRTAVGPTSSLLAGHLGSWPPSLRHRQAFSSKQHVSWRVYQPSTHCSVVLQLLSRSFVLLPVLGNK